MQLKSLFRPTVLPFLRLNTRPSLARRDASLTSKLPILSRAVVPAKAQRSSL